MAAPIRTIELRFPLGGVHRRAGYHDHATSPQEQHSTPWAVNCRPMDLFERRFRGGSRPGLASGGLAPSPSPVLVVNGSVTVYNAGMGVYRQVIPTVGSLPSGFTFGTLYRGRLLLAGGGNGAAASRQGDFTDWNYAAAAEDTGRAFLWQLSEADEKGATPTALIPHKDSHLLAATAGGLWHLSGDPTTGAQWNLSRNTGIVGKNAWTKIEDTIVFLSADGLAAVPASGGEVKGLSQEKVPDELRNQQGDDVLLAYNADEQGIYLFVDGAEHQWFYDLKAGGFWPMTLAASSVPNQTAVVDGVLRLARNGSAKAIGAVESITSDVLLGPIRLGAPGTYGRVVSFGGTLAAGSGAVAWSFVPGDSAEQAAANALAALNGSSGYVQAAGVLPAGASTLTYPRIRAPWLAVWLHSTAAWAYESLILTVHQSGRWRGPST